jgi:N-acylneuraminate cytidylyltransferase/CMP-N,N'-diacetyllegionaminic acid synthase
MMKKETIVAIITARGGSKGIPQKNLRTVLEKPLIAYTIEAALNAKTVTRTMISTDDETIAQVSEEYGAEVPFLRPHHLATDTTPTIAVLQHAVTYLAEQESYATDIIVCLQPTSPLRSAEDIDQAVNLCMQSGTDSVVSLCQAKHHPFWMKKIVDGRVHSFIEEDEQQYTRRQDLPPVYQLNGALYVTRTKILLEENRMLGEHTIPYIMPPERSIDIDTQIDLKLAECILKKEVML